LEHEQLTNAQCVARYNILAMTKSKSEATSLVAPMDRTSPPELHQATTLRSKLRGFPWRIFFITSLLFFSLALIIFFSSIAEAASQNYIRGRACYPNGLWKEATGATWRIMDSTYFFTPNLSFGNMTFTQVKVIDIAWDLLVGRGGQMALAWVNWTVFNEWLVYHAERWRTSYKMYTAVALQTTSWTMMGVAAKEFLCFGERSWERFFRWLAMFCLFISTLYVLAFPTLMAAMTGYITTYEPYMEDYDRNLIEWEKVQGVVAVVHDAERLKLGYDRPLVVVEDDKEVYQAWNDCEFLIVVLIPFMYLRKAQICGLQVSSGTHLELERAVFTDMSTQALLGR
jgi:hypothetical protein